MKIRFDRDLSRVHDAMWGLVNCYKDNYKLLYEEYDLDLNRASEEALRFIGERINLNIPRSELFFSRETATAVTFATSRFLPPDLTLDNFGEYLRGLSEEEIKLIVLSDLKSMGENLAYEELAGISQDETQILDFIRKLKLPSSIKWEALEFFSDVKTSMKGFIELVNDYIPVYKKVIKKNKNLIENFENYIASGIESEGEAFFNRFLRDTMSLDADQVIAGILFFNSRSLICTTVGEKLYVFVGMDYEETVKLVTGDGDMDINISIYKNLSDKTRFQILNLLKDQELYGQEIAEKVGITMATVSYHMSYLLASNLVKLDRVGQKGYYTLKRDTLRKSVDFLNNNFEL
jgi:DNA-binding transcriptional ArsR family regulator